MNLQTNEEKYDIILTSETIYNSDSLPKLYNVIKNSLKRPDGVAYPFFMTSVMHFNDMASFMYVNPYIVLFYLDTLLQKLFISASVAEFCHSVISSSKKTCLKLMSYAL